MDATTWQAVGLTLTVVGLVLSLLAWRRRGPASGLRGVAWSLLPAAAALTGTLKLLWQVGDEVASWAVRLVFSPVVWLGIVLAGVSVVLFGVSGAMRARGIGARSRPGKTDQPGRPDQIGQVGRVGGRERATPAARGGGETGLEDMDDIEAILRKHGIQ